MRNVRESVATVLAAASIVIATGTSSQAALPNRFYNSAYSIAPISMSDVNPPRSGHIYPIKPGYSGTGYCVYASASYLTMTWLGSGHAYAMKAGAWTCYPYSSQLRTFRVFP